MKACYDNHAEDVRVIRSVFRHGLFGLTTWTLVKLKHSKYGSSLYPPVHGIGPFCRPFIYVREHQTNEFSRNAKLPIIDENCPACFESPKERYRLKTLLAAQENVVPTLMQNLLRAMKPLLTNETFSCRYCDRRFRFESSRAEHERTHPDFSPRDDDTTQPMGWGKVRG